MRWRLSMAGLAGSVAILAFAGSTAFGQPTEFCAYGDQEPEVTWSNGVLGPSSSSAVLTYSYSPTALISLSVSVNGSVPTVLATGPGQASPDDVRSASGSYAPKFPKAGRYRVTVRAEHAITRAPGKCLVVDERDVLVTRPAMPRFTYGIKASGDGDTWTLAYSNDCSAYVARPMRIRLVVGGRRWTGSGGVPCAEGPTFYASGAGWEFEWDKGGSLRTEGLTAIPEGRPRTVTARITLSQGRRQIEDDFLRIRWSTNLVSWRITSPAEFDRCTETEDIAQVTWQFGAPYCQHLFATADVRRLIVVPR